MAATYLRDALPGIEAKAWQFAAMCARHGYDRAVLTVGGGDIVAMSLMGDDGEQHYLRLIDGELCEWDKEAS